MGALETGTATVINTVGNLSDNLGDLVSSKRQFIAKQIINVVLLLIILLVFGCFDFLHLEFHYEYLANASYWVNVGVKAVADICAYNIGVNFIIDDVIKKNEVLQKLKSTYDKLNDCKQADFEEFIAIYNRGQKVIAYKNKLTHQIFTLNKFARKKDKILYNRLVKEGKLGETKNRYCVKRKELEYLRTDAYINENIDALDINFRDVDPTVFETEIDGSQKIVQNKVTGSLSKGRAIASSTTLLGVIAGSMVIQTISLAPNQQEFENQVVAAAYYAQKISSDIAIIVWQFLRGMLGTHNIVSQQMTNPLAERVKILKKYYNWRLSKGQTVPQCYLDTLKEKVKEEKKSNEIEIEMTAEEYKKILEAQKKEAN